MILINTDSALCAEYFKILSMAESLLGKQYSARFKTIDIWKDYDEITDEHGNSQRIGEVKPNPCNYSSLIVHLPRTFNVSNTADRCLLAHEIIHSIRPSYELNNNTVINTYLEEGLAVWFQYYYQFHLTSVGLDVNAALTSNLKYQNAHNDFTQAFNIDGNTDFIKNILNGNCRRLCDITVNDLSNVCPGLDMDVINRLKTTF